MPSTNTDSLIAGSVCIHKCLPDGMKLSVLIKQFADLAGIPTDAAGIQLMLDESRCISSCIPAGLQMAVLIAILHEIASGTTPQPTCVNLIPNGARFDSFSGFYNPYSVLTGGNTYQLVWGSSETSAYINGATIQSPGAGQATQFTYDGLTIGLSGPAGQLVTATICAV